MRIDHEGRGDSAPATTEQALHACRELLRDQTHPARPTGALAAAVWTLGVCAKRERMRPEQLLVAFKRTLAEALFANTLNPSEREARRSSLVLLLIEAYYAMDGASPPTAQTSGSADSRPGERDAH